MFILLLFTLTLAHSLLLVAVLTFVPSCNFLIPATSLNAFGKLGDQRPARLL